MQHITTVSQKGQIVIPKAIRQALGLETSDSVKIELKDNHLSVEPIMKSSDAIGMIKSDTTASKKDIKNAKKAAILRKHK